MHDAIVGAEQRLGIELANLRQAHGETERALEVARSAVDEHLRRQGLASPPDHLIVAFGSMARFEMAPGSDFDYLVVLERLEDDPKAILAFRQAAHSALKQLGLDPPGQSGLFGAAVSATDFVNTIGLQTDTNLHLSRRVLLLEESIPLTDHDRHRKLVMAVTARYLHESPDEQEVPRFLLNDVIRFWRTVTVDYQAKRWDELEGTKWGLRYAKLISTRKLTYAATLVALFIPALKNESVKAGSLCDLLAIPPLARFALLAALVDGEELLGTVRDVLQLADTVTGRLADDEFREALKAIDHPREAPSGTPMFEMRELARELQSSLERLFFGSHEHLAELSKKYLAF